MMLSFGRPFVRLPRPGESTEGEVPTNEKWLKSLAVELARIGADPEALLRAMRIEGGKAATRAEQRDEAERKWRSAEN